MGASFGQRSSSCKLTMDTCESRQLQATATPNCIDVRWDFSSAKQECPRFVRVTIQAAGGGTIQSQASGSLSLEPEQPSGAFHFLKPGDYILRIDCTASQRSSSQSGESRTSSSQMKDEVAEYTRVGEQRVRLPTLPWRLPEKVQRNMLVCGQTLGPWMLDADDNYMYARTDEMKDLRFLEELFLHGLFVLPGGGPIVACPWPTTPYVLDLTALPTDRWGKSKKLRRHAGSFWLTVNNDFNAHLLLCEKYHIERGGTWITPELTAQLWRLHQDVSCKVRSWCFELWDRATGALCAASFGISMGSFFHDFSMCTLVKDHRSCGAVLSKCVGEMLARCGMKLWYWGIKCPYMAEYDNFGGREINRVEYYNLLRAAQSVQPYFEPDDTQALSCALVEWRPAGSKG